MWASHTSNNTHVYMDVLYKYCPSSGRLCSEQIGRLQDVFNDSW